MSTNFLVLRIKFKNELTNKYFNVNTSIHFDIYQGKYVRLKLNNFN